MRTGAAGSTAGELTLAFEVRGTQNAAWTDGSELWG